MQIDIPSFSISPYSFIVCLAVLTGFGVAVLLMRKFKVTLETIFYTYLLTFICTMVISISVTVTIKGGKIGAGFSGLGAGIGMVIGLFISSFIFNEKSEHIMASFVASAPLMYGLAKFGCLFAGCCHGKPYNGPFAITYHNRFEGTYFPTQLINIIAFLMIHILALILVIKLKNKFKAICIIVAVTLPVRYSMEYLRDYHDGSIIASGQVKVLIASAVGISFLIVWKLILNRLSRSAVKAD